jgi:hypothetical protein
VRQRSGLKPRAAGAAYNPGVRTLLALAAAALAAATLTSGVSAASPPAVIALVSTTTSESFVDAKPKGPSAGDRDTSTSRLANARAQFGKPKGAVVGSDRGVLTFLSARTAALRAVTKLPGGTLVVSGAIRAFADGSVVIPVTSGTGAFIGAHGTLTILKPSTPKVALNIYRLSYSPIA